MGESKVMKELADLTSNLGKILGILKENGAITEAEYFLISKYYQDSSDSEEPTDEEIEFDQKRQLFWTILCKNNASSINELAAALKSTGNELAAEKFESHSKQRMERISAEIEVQSVPIPKTRKQEPDQEGIDLADEIEKELDRIQSEDELEVVEENLPEVKPEVKIEITAPIEPKPEVVETKAEKPEAVETKAEKPEVDFAKQNGIVPKPERKQVSFGGAATEQKEFILNGEPEVEVEEKKSLVALNREKFGGGGGKVNFSISKKVESPPAKGAGAVTPKQEEATESTVKNLRSFFQQLGSDGEKGVQTRGGARNGGSGNRNTII